MESLKETAKEKNSSIFLLLFTDTGRDQAVWSNFDTTHPSNKLVPLVLHIQIRITTGWADMNLPAQECLCCRGTNPGSGQKELVLKQKSEMWGCTCHFKSLVFARKSEKKQWSNTFHMHNSTARPGLCHCNQEQPPNYPC